MENTETRLTGIELDKFAIAKGKSLNPNQMIRLTADDRAYYLINIGGVVMIGSYTKNSFDAEMKPFYKNKKIWFSGEGENELKLQKLNKGTNY